MVQTAGLVEAGMQRKLTWHRISDLLDNDVPIEAVHWASSVRPDSRAVADSGRMKGILWNVVPHSHWAHQAPARDEIDLDHNDVREVLCMLRNPLKGKK